MFDRPIQFAARYAPRTLAISSGVEHVTYEEFDRRIDRAAAALEKAGAREAGLVGISVQDQYRHLLLILGCARIGVPTVSLVPGMPRAAIAISGASMLLADDPILAPELLVDAAWIGAVMADAQAVPTRATIDPQALGRVQLSSGSTGEPKAVGMSWALMERRVAHTRARNHGFERLLSLIGPESGALPLFLWCWSYGGTVLFDSPNAAILAQSLPMLQPSGLLASPVQLSALLDALPADNAPISGLQVAVGGARLGKALAERTALRLGTTIITYASTEAGVCANALSTSVRSEAGAGWVTPWTQVQIVDEADRPLPNGTVGRIRLRGPDVVDSYLGKGGTVDDRFRDGWFYPGDIGSLEDDGMLNVDGREDEVMNLGGEKYLPHTLEMLVRQVAGVGDVAAFGLPDINGVEQPWLAVVRDGDIADGAIGRALGPLKLPKVRVAWIEALPLTALGKVRREVLRDAARALSDGPNEPN